jgi:hypothetical protein
MDLVLASSNRPPAAGREWTIHRHPVLAFVAASLLVAVIGVLGGWIAHSRGTGPVLDGVIADFESKGFASAETVAFDSSSSFEYKPYQLPVLRELGLIRGVRWRSHHQQTGQELEVRVFQLKTPAQTVDAHAGSASASRSTAPRSPHPASPPPKARSARSIASRRRR